MQGAAYNGQEKEREMEEEEIYKGMALEAGIYSMRQRMDLQHKCSQQSKEAITWKRKTSLQVYPYFIRHYRAPKAELGRIRWL